MSNYVVLWKGQTVVSSIWRTEQGIKIGPSMGYSLDTVKGKAIPSWAKSIKTSVSFTPTTKQVSNAQLISVNLFSTIAAGDSQAVVRTMFKAKSNSAQGSAAVKVSIQVRISYSDGSSNGTVTKQPETKTQGQDYIDPGLFPHRKQVAYIVDTDNGCVLNFDGVMKVSFSSQVDIQDDTSNQKKKTDYVNNAKDSPDQITLQIVESQVYTNRSKFESGYYDNDVQDVTDQNGNVTGKNWKKRMYGQQDSAYDRSRSTYQYLYQLKEARRQVDIYTRLKLFKGFVLKTLTANLSQDTTNGWTGQLVFHEYIKPDDQKSDDLSGTQSSMQSVLYRIGLRIPGKYGC